jgi:hypothetical protein
MKENQLVDVDRFPNEALAEQARYWLNAEGIPAFVEGASSNTALSYVGSALGGVRLLVGGDDWSRATQLLKQYRRKDSNEESWYCGKCREFNDASFDICWKCNQSKADVAVEQSHAVRNNLHPAISSNVNDGVENDSRNPYLVPKSLPTDERRDRQFSDEQREQVEETILRAWRAVVLSLMVPFLLNAYSVLLLLGIDSNIPLSAKSQRRKSLTWGINIAFIAFWCIVLRMMTR